MQAGPKSKLLGMLSMILVPWLMFTLTNVMFAFVFHRFPTLTWLFSAVLAFLSLLFVLVDHRNKHGGRWYLKLGFLSFFGIMAGVYLGLYNYHFHFANFWTLDENSSYVNVLPSEPASAHSDAGKLLFTVDSKVEIAKSVGYKSKDVYCVAPIVDYATQKVQYWATGTNCCQPRGGFNCDDVWSPKARSAVVLLDEIVTPFPLAHKIYKKAADQACAEWELEQADDPLFVRWVADASAVQEQYYKDGISYFVVYISVYLVFQIIVGAVLQMSSGRSMAQAQQQPLIGAGAGGAQQTVMGGAAATTTNRKIRLPPV